MIGNKATYKQQCLVDRSRRMCQHNAAGCTEADGAQNTYACHGFIKGEDADVLCRAQAVADEV